MAKNDKRIWVCMYVESNGTNKRNKMPFMKMWQQNREKKK